MKVKQYVALTILSSALGISQSPTIQCSSEIVSEDIPQTTEEIEVEETEVEVTECLIEPVVISEEELAYQLEQEEWLGECELLATLVEAEAGNQDLEGKRLVADVVLNRMDSERFPNSISEVIYQDHQFSTVLDGALDKAAFNISNESFEAVRIEALESEERLDEEVLFFTAGGYNPYCKPGYKHQDHYFGY